MAIRYVRQGRKNRRQLKRQKSAKTMLKINSKIIINNDPLV